MLKTNRKSKEEYYYDVSKKKTKKNEKNKVRDYYEKKEREKMKAKNKIYIKKIKKVRGNETAREETCTHNVKD